MTNKISLAQLQQLLRDEKTTPDDIREFFTLNEIESRGFAPVVTLDPEKVEFGDDEAALAISSFNNWSRRYRARVFRSKIKSGWVGPTCISEGDSYFQYPILLDDIIDNFMKSHAVESLGAAGDLLEAMVQSGELIATYDPSVHDFVLISGGGNDLLGEGRLQTFIRPFEPERIASRYLNSYFKPFLDNAINNFDALISGLKRKNSDVRILTHTYAYALPNNGKWLGKPLKAKGITDETLQREIIKVIVDKFHTAMKKLERRHAGNLLVVDCRKSLPHPSDWTDELHPNNAGYARIAARILAKTTVTS
ncbi:MAG: SGNH/GDSL hydrolase family protein [Ahrensia sp.]